MKTDLITDNAAAIEFLKTCCPEWIDEMPVTASIRTPGKCNIAQHTFYCEEKRQGVHALFYGTGCKKGEDGWGLLIVKEATEQEFKAAAMMTSALAAITAGLPPTAGFTFE